MKLQRQLRKKRRGTNSTNSAHAANLVDLSMQVPSRAIFLIDLRKGFEESLIFF